MTKTVQIDSPWPHRWAVALVCATFPLIWVGGLVTTYKAGMAVPDWPSTYGYNLFLYPWQTWVAGPWQLFIEHGHRLLGSLAGVLSIALVASAWWCRSRQLVRWMSVGALVGVILQGVLGGMRVMLDEVLLARLHGCVGPAFFAWCVATAVVSSKRWQICPSVRGDREHNQTGAIARLAIATTFLAYIQLVLGSMLRHLPSGSTPGGFRVAVYFHLAVAVAIAAHAVLLVVKTYRDRSRGDNWLVVPATILAGLVGLQLELGAATWIVKYGWPSWLADYPFAYQFVVSGESGPRAWIITAHVATGSLILVTSLTAALRSSRMVWRPAHMAASAPRLAEALR